jgi:gluconate 5-dehydrogenase
MVKDLKDKIVVVTGTTGHLGKQITKGFLDNGSLIVGVSSSSERLQKLKEELSDKNFFPFKSDLSLDDDVQALRDYVKENFSRCDVLVNNANYGSKALKPEDLKSDDFVKSLEGTAVSTYRVIHNFLSLLSSSSDASIVNVASMYGMVSPDFRVYEGDENCFNPIGYGAGKAAIIQMTKYLAVYLADKKIRVNCISPGPFPNLENVKSKEFIKKLEEKVPLGRIGSPEEVVGPVLFLASRMSSYVTGHNLAVDGGWTAW